MLTLTLALALANPSDGGFLDYNVEAFLEPGVGLVDDDWWIQDVAAAPEGSVVMTLDSSRDGEGTDRVVARHDGQVVHTVLEVRPDYGDLVAIDHLGHAAPMDAEVFVALTASGQILVFAYFLGPQVSHSFGALPVAVPFQELHDIAAGNGRMYLSFTQPNGQFAIAATDLSEWIVQPIDAYRKPSLPFPSIDLDRSWDRLTVGHMEKLMHFSPHLHPLGGCVLDNDPVGPHLGREFAVENGVLMYVNRTVARPGLHNSHLMHVATASECVVLDTIDYQVTPLLREYVEGWRAMSIEPQTYYEPSKVDEKTNIVSWTAFDLRPNYHAFDYRLYPDPSGLFRAEAHVMRGPGAR